MPDGVRGTDAARGAEPAEEVGARGLDAAERAGGAEAEQPVEVPHDHAMRLEERPLMFASGGFAQSAMRARIHDAVERAEEAAQAEEPALDGPRSEGRLLRRGVSGPDVEAFQRALNETGIEPPLDVDGSYGSATVDAVRRFQEQNGCRVDGIVGPETMGAIDRARGFAPHPAAAEATARYAGAHDAPGSSSSARGGGEVSGARSGGGELGGADRIIERTAQFESGGRYDAWNPDDNGHGVSFGLIQFNQEVGGLPRLLREMHQDDPQRFRETFGPHADNMLDESWVRSADLNDPDIKRRLRASGRDPVFQQTQRDVLRSQYFDPAREAAEGHGLRSERAMALVFDSAVQNGRGGTRRFLREAAAGGGFARLADRGRANGRRARILRDPSFSDRPFGAVTAAPAASGAGEAGAPRHGDAAGGVTAAGASAPTDGPLAGAPIGPGTRVLMIGDSHAVGTFGNEMDRLLRGTGATVESYGSSGASPSWWMTGRATRSGYVARHADGSVDRPHWQTPHDTPRLEALIEEHRPDVLVVSMGGNMRGLSPAGVRRQVQQLADVAQRNGTRLVWVGPPERRADNEDPGDLQRFNATLREAVAPYGGFVDSSRYTEYAGGDGVHYSGERGNRIARG
jgi:peptidoglycan hydrolase-like protein with peptidoglycan-binding domain